MRSVLFGSTRERRSGAMFAPPPIPPNSATGSLGGFDRVDLARAEASLQKVAIWACVNLVRTIAEILPMDVFTGTGRDRTQLPMPRFLADLGGDSFGIADWCSQVVYSEMLRGNAIGLIPDGERQFSGQPAQIVLQHPDRIRGYRDPKTGITTWWLDGRKVDTSTVWHKRCNPVPGQTMGLSPIEMHALTIGTGISAMRFGNQWFTDGGHPSAVLSSESKVDQTQARTIKDRFLSAVRGTREPVVLGGGMKYQAIQISPDESQFLQTNQYTSAECCRIFGPALAEVFGYETGGALTYANIEQRSLDLLTYAADPWLVRLERMLGELLPAPRYVKFNRAALVKTDLLTRYQAHNAALQNRWKTTNEVRDDEDMPPVAWGDEPNFSTYTFAERITNQAPAPVNGPPEGGAGG